MVGVGKDDFGIEVVDQIAWGKALDGALRADRHENRGFDSTVSGMQQAGAGVRVRTSGLDFKAECSHASFMLARQAR